MSKDIEALFLLGHYFAHNRNSTGVTGVENQIQADKLECPPELNLRFRFYHIWKLFEINGVLSFNLYAELTSHLQICRKAMESNQIRENGGILDECTRRALLQMGILILTEFQSRCLTNSTDHWVDEDATSKYDKKQFNKEEYVLRIQGVYDEHLLTATGVLLAKLFEDKHRLISSVFKKVENSNKKTVSMKRIIELVEEFTNEDCTLFLTVNTVEMEKKILPPPHNIKVLSANGVSIDSLPEPDYYKIWFDSLR